MGSLVQGIRDRGSLTQKRSMVSAQREGLTQKAEPEGQGLRYVPESRSAPTPPIQTKATSAEGKVKANRKGKGEEKSHRTESSPSNMHERSFWEISPIEAKEFWKCSCGQKKVPK